MWRSIRLALMRVFRVPVRVTVQRMEVGPERLPDTAERLRIMAGVFHVVPGLREQWMDGLDDVITSMAKTPATEAFHGERIRLCQRAVDLWQCLRLPQEAAKKYNEMMKPVEEFEQPKPSSMVL